MGKLYVGNALDDTVSVINTEDCTEHERIKLEGVSLGPRRLLVFNNVLYTANSNASSISYIDLGSGTQGRISVGSYPIGMCRIKKKLFVCCGESNSVWRIDMTMNRAELCCSAGVFPLSIISSENEIYVSCLLSCEVLKIKPSLIVNRRIQIKALAMSSIAVKNGMVVCCLAGEGKGEMVLLNKSMNIAKRIILQSPVDCMAMLPDGNKVVAAHLWDNSLCIIDLDTFEIAKTLKTGRMPDQVLVEGDKIFLSCIMSNCVDVFSIDGEQLTRINVGREPRGMALSTDIPPQNS